MVSTAIKELPNNLVLATGAGSEVQKRLLLIEDSEEAMYLVQCAIEEHGRGAYRLEWAAGLTEGLEKLVEGGIDLVLLDLGLPESSGPASYAWVREAAPDVAVVVLTGDTCEETEFAIAASGVDDYLIKDDISGAMLIDSVRTVLQSRHRRTKLSSGTPNEFWRVTKFQERAGFTSLRRI